MTSPSQIDTHRDAVEFLTGEWALGHARYTAEYCDTLRTSTLITLARMHEAEDRKAQQ